MLYRVIDSIEHFYGHLDIACTGKMGLCSIEHKEDVEQRKEEILAFVEKYKKIHILEGISI